MYRVLSVFLLVALVSFFWLGSLLGLCFCIYFVFFVDIVLLYYWVTDIGDADQIRHGFGFLVIFVAERRAVDDDFPRDFGILDGE